MRGFDPAFMNELKARNNIVEVISGYASLERKGANYWACCPFHHEKTPSFSVNANDQFYHCFGCGVSGDVIKFVQEIESIEFIDAVKLLADRVKMTVPEANFNTEEIIKRKKHKDTLLKIMLETAKFYRNNLYGDRAGAHVEYLTGRKIQPSTIKKFGFGASLDFRTLPVYLQDKGFAREDLLASGVCAEGKNNTLYDSQGGRLIIPIINSFDEVIAFGGRLLEKADFAKYKNTKETILFNKSKTLYNINLLKKLKKSQPVNNVIVVEGYMDAITVYQAGFHNVVASMGTALTLDQARLLKRYTDHILVSFDGDSAGQQADLRGIEILKNEGLNVKVVPITGGKDPDEVIKAGGAEAYRACLDRAMPLIDYKLYALERKYDLSKVEEKRTFVSQSLKIIKNEPESTVREELVGNLSRKTGLSVFSLNADMANVKRNEEPDLIDDLPEEKKEKEIAWTKGIPNKVVEASRFILASKLFDREYSRGYALKSEFFTSEVHIEIAEYINECERTGERIRPSQIFEMIDEEDAELGKILDLYTEDKLLGADAADYFKDCAATFETHMIKNRLRILTEQLNGCANEDEKKFLLEKMSELTLSLKKGE